MNTADALFPAEAAMSSGRVDLCALVLAAGAGRRLQPITATIPKALCPVGNVALLDRALHRLAEHGLAGPDLVAVNACYLADRVVGHVGARARLSVEPTALGTAGAVAELRGWIAGRAVLVGNADAYLSPTRDLASDRARDLASDQPSAPARDLAELLAGWDGETVRVLGVPAEPGRPAEFGSMRFAGFSLLPGSVAADLPRGASELVHQVWRPAERAGRLEVIHYEGFYLDTGTPVDFLAANLHAASGSANGSLVAAGAEVSGTVDRAVVGAGARVSGSVTRSVVFPGGEVGPAEKLWDAIRVGADLTVQT
jgi:MurNAc alpha-1-phosphate uridylyltransferase